MRRIILLLVLSMCAKGVFAMNEVVAAIAYNPSRLGAYENLVAHTTAKFVGGIVIQAGDNPGIMNIQSKGGQSIALRDAQEAHKCTVEHCRITDEGNDKKRTLNIIKNITPNTDNIDGIETSASLKGTLLKRHFVAGGTDVWLRSFSIAGGSVNKYMAPSGTDVTINGGTLQVNKDAYIYGFKNISDGETVKNLKITTNKLTTGYQVAVPTHFHVKEGFTLGNVTISAAGGEQCGITANKCKRYEFKDVAASDGTHKLLSVVK